MSVSMYASIIQEDSTVVALMVLNLSMMHNVEVWNVY